MVVITGYVGQISLAQNAFAGISAFMIAHIGHRARAGLPVGLILGALCAVVFGVDHRPAGRARARRQPGGGDARGRRSARRPVFNAGWFSGGYNGMGCSAPHLFGLNLGLTNSGQDSTARVRDLLSGRSCAHGAVRRAIAQTPRLGRMFIAVRSNERAASAVGVDVARTKLFAFGISAFIAGIGGGLLAYQQIDINPASFTAWSSLTILAITYVGSVGRIGGAVFAGVMLASNGVMATLLNNCSRSTSTRP